MAYDAGTAVIQITPSFLNIESMLAKGARNIAQGLDKALGNQLGKAMENASDRAEKSSDRAGRKLGAVFAERAIKQVETALGNIPDSDRVLKPLRKELEALAKIDLGKGFDERDFIKRLEKVHDALRRAQQDAQGINAVGRHVNAGNAAEALGAARQMIDEARRRGFEAGDAWTNAFQTRLRQMRTALPDLKVRADSTDDERQAAAIRARVQALQALKVGDVATRDHNPLSLPIGVKINRADLARELSIIEGLLDNFVERFENSDLTFPVDKARQQAGAFFDDVKTQEQKAAEAGAAAYLKAYDEAYREQARRDKAAQDEMSRNHEAAIKEDFLRRKRAEADYQRDHERALAEDARLQRRAFDEVQREQEKAFRDSLKRKADLLRNTTAGRVQQGALNAANAIQEIPVHLQTRAIHGEISEIRSRLEALGDVQIGVHYKAEEIADKVQAEFVRLKAIAKDQNIEINVRADAAKAATELGAILALLNRIDHDKATVKVDTSGAVAGLAEMLGNLSLNLGRLGALIAIGSSIGTAIVPAAAAAASAIGAIGTVALAAGAGIGVMVLGFSGISDAVGALSKAADDQTQATTSLGRSASQVASAQDQVRAAEAALANTRRNNAEAALRAQRSIKDAIEEQHRAVRDVARANRDAAEDQKKTIKDVARENRDSAADQQKAIKDVARANRDAAEDLRDARVAVERANQDAVERYTEARHDAAQADLDAERAQLGLAEAYRAAQRAIDDLNASIRGNALDQRQASLDIAKAKEELDKLVTNPRATEAEIEQARINYEQRLLQMDNLQRKAAEMSDEQDKRFAAGLEGSEEVKRAEEQITAATERTRDAQKALKRAAENVDRTRIEGQEKLRDAQEKVDKTRTDGEERLREAQERVDRARIEGQEKLREAQEKVDRARIEGQDKLRDAQRRVGDAQRAAADQQKDAAYSMLTANQSLISAQRALANAYRQSSVAGGASMNNVNTAMGKLSPTAQKFARFLFGLRDAFFALRREADPMVAGMQRAMEILVGKTSADAIKNLQPLFNFVGRVATKLGEIFVRFANTLKGPTFTRFFNYISSTAVPTLDRMYTAFENILVGVTNLFLAFTPLSGNVEEGFVGMTASFRKWSEGLETNKGFQRFLDYLRDSGPQVMALVGQIVTMVTKLVIAAAPIGAVVIKAFTGLIELINKIPQKVLLSLVAGISAAATAIAIFAGVTAAAALGVPGAIAAVVAALVVGFSVLVGSSDGLRETLVQAWDAIKKGAVQAWEVLWPILKQLGQLYVDFWKGIVVPALKRMSQMFADLWVLAAPVLKQLGGMFAWLWKNAILPAAKGIWTVIKQLWEIIKPVFDIILTILEAVGTAFWWLMRYVIVPVVGAIVYVLVKTLGPVFRFLWAIIQPILKAIGLGIQVTQAIIKVAVGLMLITLKSLGLIFKWLYDKAIKPAWDALVENVFRPMGEWINKHIAPTWDKAMKKLGEIWEGLKKKLGVPIKFVVETLLNDGLLKGYNWLADLFDINPKNVKIPTPKGGWTGFATGGAVNGPGTGTSDSIRARLSRGEHVLTAREVQLAGGHEAIYRLRQAILAGRLDPGFATGGAVGGRRGVGDGFGDWLKKVGKGIKDKASDVFDGTAQFLRDPAGSLKILAKTLFDKVPGKDIPIVQKLLSIPSKVLEALQDKVKDLFGGLLGGQSSGGQEGVGSGTFGNTNALGGSGGMMKILRVIFPGLNLNSGFRPGAITVTGNRSYHSRNRAVDVPPRRDVFEWIRKNYPNSRELIFSPMGSRQIWNGQPHVYSGVVKRGHYCVPMDTEILTRRGWLTWDQVAVGDETPGFNFESGRTEWTRVTGGVQYDNAELIEARSHSWSVRTTGGHRWVSRDSLTGSFYWNTMDGAVEGDGQPTRKRHGNKHSWVIAAEMVDGPGLPVTVGEAELIGWMVSEGSQHDGVHHRGVNFSVHIWQSKPVGVARLAELLGEKASWNGKGYRLRNAYARDLMTRAGLTHIKNAEQLLLAITEMTAEQRCAMLAGVIGGDGSTWMAKYGTAPSLRITQDEGPLLEVITTLAYLCGHRTTVTKHKCSSGCWKHNGTPLVINLGQPIVSTYNQGRTVTGSAPVWCPTTELGTWTARFGHNVVLTGNSHVHWAYDKGGLLPDTRNMPGGVMQVFHGRRTPDKVLTDTQWASMAALAGKARQSMAGGDTWNFDFKDTTLDEGRLLAIQARRDALNRVNRINY